MGNTPARIRCAQDGFTLLEATISVAIVGLILSMIGGLISSAERFYVNANARDHLFEQCRRIVTNLETEVMVARVLGVNVGAGPGLEYVVPVDVGEDENDNGVLDAGEDENGNGVLDLTDGDVSSSVGSLQLGCIEADRAHLDLVGTPHRISLGYAAGETVSEASIKFDINGDGDSTDSFVLGSLTRTTSQGPVVSSGAGSVLLTPGAGNGDRDGDGIGDPLFSMSGESFTDTNGNGVWNAGEVYVDSNGSGAWDGRLLVHLTLFLVDGRQEPHVLQLRREIGPRNTEGK